MRRRWWIGGLLTICALAGATPGLADSGYGDGGYRRYGPDNSVRLRLGLFTPDGKGDYFRDTRVDFTGDAKDLEDAVGGVDYELRLAHNLGLLISTDFFEGRNDQSYRDFEDNRGHNITHTTTLDITPVTAGLVVHLAPEGAPIVPYVGAGGGVYAWRLREKGDFIDFGDPNLTVFHDKLEADGAALGYYLQAGLDVPVSPYFSIFGEARWDRADDKLNRDFDGFGTIDLSGRRVMGGVAWHF